MITQEEYTAALRRHADALLMVSRRNQDLAHLVNGRTSSVGDVRELVEASNVALEEALTAGKAFMDLTDF